MPRIKKKLFEEEAEESKASRVTKRKAKVVKPTTPKKKKPAKVKMPATPKKKFMEKPVQVKLEKLNFQPKEEPSQNKEEIYKVLKVVEDAYCIYNKKHHFLINKSELETLNLKEDDLINITNAIIKTNQEVKELILPANSIVSKVTEEINIERPKPALTGVVGLSLKEKIFLNTENGIKMIRNPANIKVKQNVNYEFHLISRSTYRGLYTTKNSFVKEVAMSKNLTSQNLTCENIKEKQRDSLHYVEGSIYECVFIKNESDFSEEKMLWGIFKMVLENGDFLDVTMIHDAFEFFNVDFDKIEKGDFESLKDEMTDFFKIKSNRANVRALIKVGFREKTQQKQYEVQGVEVVS